MFNDTEAEQQWNSTQESFQSSFMFSKYLLE